MSAQPTPNPTPEPITLDAMYGAGTAAKFTGLMNMSSVVPNAVASVTATPLHTNRGVAVEVNWKAPQQIALYRLIYEGTEVICTALAVEAAYQQSGILTFLIEQMEPFWTSLGITVHTMFCEPGSEAELALLSAGFGPLPNGSFGTPIPAPRPQEYLAWVKAGATPTNEPTWRSKLTPPPTPVF